VSKQHTIVMNVQCTGEAAGVIRGINIQKSLAE